MAFAPTVHIRKHKINELTHNCALSYRQWLTLKKYLGINICPTTKNNFTVYVLMQYQLTAYTQLSKQSAPHVSQGDVSVLPLQTKSPGVISTKPTQNNTT